MKIMKNCKTIHATDLFRAGSARNIAKKIPPFLFLSLPLLAAGFLLCAQDTAVRPPETRATRTLDPHWTKALGGDALSPIHVFQDAVYVLGTDRSLTCISEKGVFLWRKPLGFRPAAFFLVSKTGLVCLFARGGEMRVFSLNGSPFWSYTGKQALPILPPFEGRDGRLFLLYEDEMVCLAANGLQKWRRSINAKNAVCVGEDGFGNILVCSGDAITRVSPWGDVSKAIPLGATAGNALGLDGTGCAFFVPTSGSATKIVALDTASLFSPKAAGVSAALWESGALPTPAAAIYHKGTLYYAGTDGTVTVFNATDGNVLAAAALSGGAAGGSRLTGASFSVNVKEGEERLVLAAEGLCAGLSLAGEVLWTVEFSRKLLSPVFTENGFVVSSPQNTVMRGFLAEFSLNARDPGGKPENHAGYGIFRGKSSEYGISYQPGVQALFPYFENARRKIKDGSIGIEEVEVSRRLAETLKNDTGNPYSDNRYTDTERSQAAAMLGELGSEEARAVLLAAARSEKNDAVLSGVLYGISALGPDASGETLDTVSFIIRSSKNSSPIHRAAAAALHTIARTSPPGAAAEDAMKLLIAYTKPPYDGAIQKYAQQMLENLLQ